MSSSTSNAIPPTGSVPVEQQKEGLDQSNGAPPEISDETVKAAKRIQQKYAEERDKRVRPEGLAQYIDLSLSDKYKHFRDDPWLDERSETVTLEDGARRKFLIIGGGFGGVLFACKLVKEGMKAEDIALVEVAGGFGGTWYWNRYPGLMCDVESYVYLPMLEEMGYMPKHKYSYGPEIRRHVNLLAEKYGIAEQAMFRTKVNSLVWDDEHKEWTAKLIKERKGDNNLDLTIRAQFVMSASGLLLYPKLPDIPGIETFKGHSFHTSRWDYAYTGGSDENPELVNLKDKRVGIMGTGATAIQAVPHLAKWAKELIVFQRTPSQVDIRGQRETDSEWWQKEIQGRKGWQRERINNLSGHLSGLLGPDDPNMVGDEWSKMRAYRALTGTPGIVPMEEVPGYVAQLHAWDVPRSERVRARCDEIVKDKETAQKLKSWFPSWCKRPTFHDDYLQVFNQDNVKLVDTNGQGIGSLTEDGPVYDGKEYPLDLLVWSTGFRAPGIGSPAFAAGMTVKGRNGLSMDEKWKNGIATLHGVTTRDFPNFFWPGPYQAAASANFSSVLDLLTSHIAHIIAEAEKYAAKEKLGARYSIEPSKEAEDNWGMQVVMRAAAFAGMAGCTPSYLNGEGAVDRLPPEARMAMAKMSIWGEGILNFTEVLDKWQAEGKLEGLEVSTG